MSWNALRSYGDRNLRAISLPVGGIGTGTIGFGGRGQLRDWELENHPAKGFRPAGTFFACRFGEGGRDPDAFLLEGPLFDEEIEGAEGSTAPVSGLKRPRACRFETTYPFGRVRLGDPELPLDVTIEGWNPLVPLDEEASGLPIAVFDVTLASRSRDSIDLSVMLSLEALVGHRLRVPGVTDGSSRPTIELASGAGGASIVVGDEGLDPRDEEWGSLAARVLGPDTFSGGRWRAGLWKQGLSAMWTAFVRDGEPGEGLFRSAPGEPISGCVGARRRLGPLATTSVRFVLGWHFPNRRAWTFSGPGPRGGATDDIVGNWYCTRYAGALEAIDAAEPRLDELRRSSEAFAGALLSTDHAEAVKEAALFNLSTLRSPTFFRTADGRPYGWEGCLDDAGSCPGSCTHVWNYELATPFLFPGLARDMRRIAFLHSTSETGAMSFRTLLPLQERAQEFGLAAADGQYGQVLGLLRDWRASGDARFLAELWPACRRAVGFGWLPGSWDADQDGVAEGCLHNTMDVEYYGPTGIIQGWYLGALGAAAEMADAVGDAEFAVRCRRLRDAGADWTEANLFNGRYYAQQVRPPRDFDSLRPEVRHPSMGATVPQDPEFQVGDGCQVDQLVGDVAARIAGAGPVFDVARVDRVLDSIHEFNHVSHFGWWTSSMRTFVTNQDQGHVVCSYPQGLPEHPMPYWSEVMTGFEYVYALGLLQAGRRSFAEEVVKEIRDRYDGRTRNPFDEAECGHHYARAMASWGLINATSGIDYDGRSGVLAVPPACPEGRWLWAAGGAWGVLERRGDRLSVEVLGGSLDLTELRWGAEATPPATRHAVSPGTTLTIPRVSAIGP